MAIIASRKGRVSPSGPTQSILSTVSVTIPALSSAASTAGGACKDVTFAFAGITTLDLVRVHVTTALSSGLMIAQAFCSTAGSVTLRIGNDSEQNYAAGTATMAVMRVLNQIPG